MCARNEEIRTQIKDLLGCGLRQSEIARELGVSRERVRKLVTEMIGPGVVPQQFCRHCGKPLERSCKNGPAWYCDKKCAYRAGKPINRALLAREAGLKKCSRCQQKKPLESFSPKSGICKVCANQRAKDIYRKRKEQRLGLTPLSQYAIMALQAPEESDAL